MKYYLYMVIVIYLPDSWVKLYYNRGKIDRLKSIVWRSMGQNPQTHPGVGKTGLRALVELGSNTGFNGH